MLLKIGSTGEEVKKLQEKLGLPADGSFGPMTETKVKEWQRVNGLTPDGIVGDGTWGKMFPAAPLVIPASPFKLDKLVGHIPDNVIVQIPDTAAKFNITNTLRLAHFLAQCGHESAGFRFTQENLNYATAQLPKMWPSLFNATNAAQYGGKAQAIANRAYGGRMGNGPEASGDGWKFRGRGYIQLTGKNNYTQFDKFVDDDILANPDLVATKYPLMSAAFFFNVNSLWAICDQGATDAVVTSVTRRVNGGTIGLADRLKHFKEYYALLA